MEVRDAANAKDVKYYTTDRLREEFHIANLFTKDNIRMVYSHIDRIITAGLMPVYQELQLVGGKETAAIHKPGKSGKQIIKFGIQFSAGLIHARFPDFLAAAVTDHGFYSMGP